MIYDDGVDRTNFDSSGLSTGYAVGVTVTDVEGQMLGTLRGAFADIKDKPVSELGADWRNEMFARVASVRASFLDAYKARQGEIVSALKTSVTNGFQVGAQTTKRDLSAAGIKYPERVYTLNDATRGTEQIATAFTRTLAAEATSIDAATQAFVSAIAAVSAGVGGTVAQVFDAAVLPRVRNGLTGVVTASGAELGVANYLEGLTRETSQQALLVGESVVADAAGLHLVRISAHASCCPKCEPWQGQILVDDYFANGQPDGVHGSLRAAIDAGLFHWNCRHKKTIWYQGVKEAKGKEDYDPDKVADTYRIEQQQRALERKIREYKRLAATALDPDTAAHAEQNVRIYQAALSKLVADARHDHYPIYRQYNKEQVGFDYGKWDPYGIHGGNDDDFHGGGGGGYNGGGGGTLPVNGDNLPQETVGRVQDSGARVIPPTDRAFLSSKKYEERFGDFTGNATVREAVISAARDCVLANDGKNRERLIVVDANSGKWVAEVRPLVESEGTASAPVYPSHIQGRRSILIHNHPSGGAFSVADISTMLRHRSIAAMVAAGSECTVHTMRRDPNSTITVKIDAGLDTEILKVYNDMRALYRGNPDAAMAAVLQYFGLRYYKNGRLVT